MKSTKLTLLTAVCAFAAAVSACGGAAIGETAKTDQPANANSSAATQQAKTETKTEIKTAIVKQSTPTETGESFFNAVKTKDKAAFKQLMAEDSTLILKAAAQAKSTTLDELLDAQFFPNTPMPDKCEQRGEKITGDRAAVEMKDAKGEWAPITYVKENGVWKVSLE